MGITNDLYQLKPGIINSGTILRVRKNKEAAFLKKYTIVNQGNNTNAQGIFSNTFIINSEDGKIERISLFATDRIIDFNEPGIYISLQSGSKSGFGSDFNDFFSTMATYLEDALFYILWDDIISRYEIINGTLNFRSTRDFTRWNCLFEEYVVDNYADSKQLLADFYVEKANEMILRHDEIISEGEDPKERHYDVEDYQELLQQLLNYKSHIAPEKLKQLNDWLEAQIYDTICIESVVTASQSIYDENEVYMQGKFEIRINAEKPYAESDIIDISEFLKSMVQNGEYFIFSCCCGVPSCSGWVKGIQVEHFDTTIRWTNLNTWKEWYFEKHRIEDDIKTIREEDKVYEKFFAKKEIEYIGVGDYWNTEDELKN